MSILLFIFIVIELISPPVAVYPGELAGSPGPIVLAGKGPVNAPITLIEFSDFQCPFCARVSSTLKQLLKLYPGQIRWVFKHYPLSFHRDAPLAHEAALAAGEQGKFWEMHDLLFANQIKLKREDLIGYARRLGLEMQTFVAALDSHKYQALIEHDVSEARAFGVRATPTFFVNGQKLVGAKSLAEFQAIIDEQLGRGKPVSASRPFTIELKGSPVRGPEEAPVTIVEFSDFQCPFCGRASPTVEQLLRLYPGRVRWVFKHYPLSFHRDAPLAHEAALAAGEQGKFWEMHDLLFANQTRIKRADLIRYAKQLGLNMDLFLAALDSGEYRAIVERDKAEGARLGVNSTPAFFINDKKLVGAQPIAAFQDLIEKELSHLKVDSAPPIADRSNGMSVKGSADAPVTVSVFADFQSPMSTQAAVLMKKILLLYPENVKFIFKHFPLRFHRQAKLAHEAALAVGEQGKFWEMHDLLFQNQRNFQPEHLSEYAERLGLDMTEFNQALEEHRYSEVVRQDLLDGMNRDVRGVPTFFINGKRLDGAQTVLALRTAIDEALMQQLSSKQEAQVSETRLRIAE